jgi:hypothetical protein
VLNVRVRLSSIDESVEDDIYIETLGLTIALIKSILTFYVEFVMLSSL